MDRSDPLAPTRTGPSSDSRWFAAAKLAASAELAPLAIRPLLDEQGRLLGLLALDTGRVDQRAPAIVGWWFSPNTPGRWIEARDGRWNDGHQWRTLWRSGGWSDFLAAVSGRPLVAEGMRNILTPIKTSLGQFGSSGQMIEGMTPELAFLRRPLADLHEAAEGIAASGVRRPEHLTLEELSRIAGLDRPGRDDRGRLVAAALVWSRSLAPALRRLAANDALAAPPRAPLVYWPSMIDPAKEILRGPVPALALWLPHGELRASTVLSIPDLRVLAGPTGMIELHGRGTIAWPRDPGEAEEMTDLTIGLKRPDARRLLLVLHHAWVLDLPARLDLIDQQEAERVIRLEAYLRPRGGGFGIPRKEATPRHSLSSRAVMITFVSDHGEERLLPDGPALKIETGSLGSDPTEGLVLFISVPDGGPRRFADALRAALASAAETPDPAERPLGARLAAARGR